MCNIRSNLGAKAAWKGFSSQTIYIAYRLMLLENEYVFFPESVEDLKIEEEAKIVELVQIKNLSCNLSLSNLSPQNEDSFFKRALAKRQEGENFILHVVSFGDIGEELMGFQEKNDAHVESIKSKLATYGYTADEINWLISNLTISRFDEDALKEEIYSKLIQRIETMAAPQVAFNILICYVSDLSRYAGSTSQKQWENKLDDIVKDIATINGICAQYGKTIIQLKDYRSFISDEELKEQFRAGINAHPDHIRKELDIIREKWLQDIQNVFSHSGHIAIVKGASGQGKSSLAYRYLIDNYPEEYVFLVEKVTEEQQAIDIVAALNGLAAVKSKDIIVYMDVAPYDKQWIWIAEEIDKRGIDLNLLITIREEDFNRSDFDVNRINAKILELSFDKQEAKEIYNKYHSPYFLNFDQAWNRFGEQGPFMEFMYLLNEADTLKNKLKSQIKQIVNHEVNADGWLNILQVVSYAGRYSLKVDIQKLIKLLNPAQARKMLLLFEKEYLIKFIDDEKYVEPLHAVRAVIVYNILEQDSAMDESATLLCSLKVINGFFQPLLVRYFFNHIENAESYIDEIITISFDSWTSIASVLSSILWIDAYRFYLKNKAIIKEGNKSFFDSFKMFLGDVTGFLDFSYKNFKEIFEKRNPEAFANLEKLIDSLPQKKIDYRFTDIFIKSNKALIEKMTVNHTDNLSEIGFILFWLAQRSMYLEKDISGENILGHLENISIDELLDFIVGLQVQHQDKLYTAILDEICHFICRKYNIIYLDSSKKNIEAEFIQDIFTENTQDNSLSSYDQTMRIIDIMRRLFYFKEKYHVKAIGTNLIPDLQIPDIEKNISAKNLPLVWLTQMNNWIMKIEEYWKRPNTWLDFKNQLDYRRNTILAYVSMVNGSLNYFFKKDGNITKFIGQQYEDYKKAVLAMEVSALKTPKCDNDKFGLKYNKNKVELQSAISLTEIQSKEKNIVSYANGYINSFIEYVRQMEALIVSRYEGKEPNETERLSLINLVSSVNGLLKMQSKYRDLFSSLDFKEDINNEYKQLLLLVNVWSYLYKYRVIKNNSIIYDAKERIKQYRKNINGLFKEVFEKYSAEVTKRTPTKIVVRVSGSAVDDLCKEIYINFKTRFPEMETLSVDSLFLNEFAEEIILLVTFNGRDYIGGFRIELSNLLFANETKFLLYRIALNKNEVKEFNEDNDRNFDDAINNAVKIFGNLYILSMFFNHTTEVVQHIASSPNREHWHEDVFEIWRDRAVKLHTQLMDDIIESVNKLKSVIVKEQLENINSLILLLENYKLESSSIVLTHDKRQMEEKIAYLTQITVHLVDHCCL